MRTIGAFEAKTHLSKLLDKVAAGEKIAITKHGVPVAMLSPMEAVEKPDVAEAIQSIRKMRKGTRLRGLSVRKMIEEGRRF
ncbi:MAG: type II toxin-antitoxin system Phd/YefM family antitoxin [Burkholderiales bacterium]